MWIVIHIWTYRSSIPTTKETLMFTLQSHNDHPNGFVSYSRTTDRLPESYTCSTVCYHRRCRPNEKSQLLLFSFFFPNLSSTHAKNNPPFHPELICHRVSGVVRVRLYSFRGGSRPRPCDGTLTSQTPVQQRFPRNPTRMVSPTRNLRNFFFPKIIIHYFLFVAIDLADFRRD